MGNGEPTRLRASEIASLLSRAKLSLASLERGIRLLEMAASSEDLSKSHRMALDFLGQTLSSEHDAVSADLDEAVDLLRESAGGAA